jgi:Concanavalin A-like lectin/glucanases superfamily/Immunoglobulin domain
MHKIRTLRLVAIMVAGLLGVANLSAQPFGLWNFDSGDLSATVGSALTYADATATAAATTFGTTTSFSIADISGTPAAVMNFPAATNGMGYSMPTPAANVTANAVNQYTLLLDVFYPAASSTKIRPLIRTYASGGTEQYIIVNATGGVGPAVVGSGGITAAGVGALQPNTWYRLGLVVNAGVSVRVYTNGLEMGSFTGGNVDEFFAMDPSATALILGSTSTNAASGYVNSIQLRNVALNAGQMAALGAASASGIPQIIPPVPSFIDSRTPGVGEANVSEEPAISVVLNQGDTVVTGASIQLKLDGVVVGATTETPPGSGVFTSTYTVPPRLDPLSVHTLDLTWNDSVAGSRSSTWAFTVKDYQVVTLPSPFYFQDFDGLTENETNGVALPAGWSVQNQTAPGTAGFSLTDRTSDSYKDWILIAKTRFDGWDDARTNLPTIILNGTKLLSLTSGNLLWAESDSRCGGCTGQFADLYTGSISCVGKTNVFVAWNSIYMQNNDNMNFMEYSIDNGVNWLPVIYMFQWPPDEQEPNPQIIYTNSVIDVGATFSQIAPTRNWSPDTPVHSTNYGSYIKAPISTALIPFIKGYGNDDSFGGKRIEVVRLAAADGQANVRFRANANGTSAWFWGIDDFGLYEITTPVFTTQPANSTIAAGTVGTFTVVVASPTAITYQWQHAGTNISNGGHYSGVNTATLTVSNADPNDAGSYRCKATNASGPTTSNPANLTVVAVPTVTTQPNSMVVSDGYPAGFSGLGFGGLPLTYEWRLGTTPVGNGTSYNLPSAHAANAGNYTLVIMNSYGSVTSRVARLSVVNVPVTSDLVAHLKFDGDYTDSSGHGNNATPINGPSLVPGKLGSALQFTTSTGVVPAVTNFATLGYPTDLQFGSTTDFSIAFWVNYTNQSDDLALISNSQWDSGSNPGWGIFSQGSGSFRVKASDVNRVTANTGGVGPVIENNGWHHILVTFQQGGAMYTMYDGVLVRTNVWTPTASVDTSGFDYQRTITNNTGFTGPHAINIGQDGTGWYNDKNGGAITNGLIDDVGFWRRAVSPQEALAIYTAGNAGKNLSLAAASLPPLTITYSAGNVNLTWAGGAGIRLQKTTDLTNPLSWTDIASTLGNSSYSEAVTPTPTNYRLYKP